MLQEKGLSNTNLSLNHIYLQTKLISIINNSITYFCPAVYPVSTLISYPNLFSLASGLFCAVKTTRYCKYVSTICEISIKYVG